MKLKYFKFALDIRLVKDSSKNFIAANPIDRAFLLVGNYGKSIFN